MDGKEEVNPPEHSEDSWVLAGRIQHDIESQRLTIFAAIETLEHELGRQGIHLAHEHFECIYDALEEMGLILQVYTIVSAPTERMSFSLSRVSLSNVIYSAVKSRRNKEHYQTHRTRIRITGCESTQSLWVSRSLFPLALRGLLSRRLVEIGNPELSFIDIICSNTQDKQLIQFRYSGACVDESFRDYLLSLTPKRGEKVLSARMNRLELELEFTRKVLISHGADIQVTDTPGSIEVSIRLPKTPHN